MFISQLGITGYISEDLMDHYYHDLPLKLSRKLTRFSSFLHASASHLLITNIAVIRVTFIYVPPCLASTVSIFISALMIVLDVLGQLGNTYSWKVPQFTILVQEIQNSQLSSHVTTNICLSHVVPSLSSDPIVHILMNTAISGMIFPVKWTDMISTLAYFDSPLPLWHSEV